MNRYRLSTFLLQVGATVAIIGFLMGIWFPHLYLGQQICLTGMVILAIGLFLGW